ncbi:MAG: hypothetical protein JWQ09_886, partial [Segetibacter sp.]|nr:hypothetical protein [Segetibacter sp.]
MKVVADKDLLKEKLESTIKKLQGR